jgi:hypothetical protein
VDIAQTILGCFLNMRPVMLSQFVLKREFIQVLQFNLLFECSSCIIFLCSYGCLGTIVVLVLTPDDENDVLLHVWCDTWCIIITSHICNEKNCRVEQKLSAWWHVARYDTSSMAKLPYMNQNKTLCKNALN